MSSMPYSAIVLLALVAGCAAPQSSTPPPPDLPRAHTCVKGGGAFAVIEVAEENTEAAAATAVVIAPRAVPARPVTPETFRVDHPFLFVIRDDKTGAIQFVGQVNNPNQAS